VLPGERQERDRAVVARRIGAAGPHGAACHRFAVDAGTLIVSVDPETQHMLETLI
jgi:hypothetical protein